MGGLRRWLHGLLHGVLLHGLLPHGVLLQLRPLAIIVRVALDRNICNGLGGVHPLFAPFGSEAADDYDDSDDDRESDQRQYNCESHRTAVFLCANTGLAGRTRVAVRISSASLTVAPEARNGGALPTN